MDTFTAALWLGLTDVLVCDDEKIINADETPPFLGAGVRPYPAISNNRLRRG